MVPSGGKWVWKEETQTLEYIRYSLLVENGPCTIEFLIYIYNLSFFFLSILISCNNHVIGVL